MFFINCEGKLLMSQHEIEENKTTATLTSASPSSQQAEIIAESNENNSLITIDTFMKVELRVGEIVAAEKLPKSKKLLKLRVNLGDKLGERQILAGIALHYDPETLLGKRIVVVANLQPAKLMGEESQGMLLAASPDDDSMVALVSPAPEIPLGSRVR
jgi:methionyl-tRNA synthetase